MLLLSPTAQGPAGAGASSSFLICVPGGCLLAGDGHLSPGSWPERRVWPGF